MKSTSYYDVRWEGPPKRIMGLSDELCSLSSSDLPHALRPWIVDIAERMQVPLEFVAIPAIVAASSLIGRQIGVFPKQKDDWLVIANLWGMIVAHPGWMKSPAMNEALRPIEIIQQELSENYRAQRKIFDEQLIAHNIKLDGLKEELKKSIKQRKFETTKELKANLEEVLRSINNSPKEQRLKINDATVEKTAIILAENPNGLLMVRDELPGWLSTLNKKGKEGDREFFLESWNGFGSYSVDRVGRRSIYLPAICLSILGGIQPNKLNDYIRSSDTDLSSDGLLQRFQLTVFPELSREWKNIDRFPNEKNFYKALDAYQSLQKLSKLGKKIIRRKNSFPGLSFSEPARGLFLDWRTELESLLRSNFVKSQSLLSHYSKYRSLVPALSLIFHLLNLSDNTDIADTPDISDRSLQKALSWEKVLRSHAKKIYSESVKIEYSPVFSLANKIIFGHVTDGFKPRTIYRKGWSGLETASKLEKVLKLLKELNWVQKQKIENGSVISEIVRIHPRIKELGHELL